MDQTRLFGAALIGAIVLITSLTSTGLAASSISIFSLNSEILPTDDVYVTGFVNTKSFFKPVMIEVYDPEGELLYSPLVNFNENGQFSWLFHPPNGKFEKGGPYTIFASHENSTDIALLHFIVMDENMEDSSLVKVSGNESEFTSNELFESFEIIKTSQEVSKSELSLKTSKPDLRKTSNDEIEILKTNEFFIVTPILVSSVAGIVVIWFKATNDNSIDQKSSKF